MELARLYANHRRLERLALPNEELQRLKLSLTNYQRYARLIIRLEEASYPKARFGAVQVDPAANGRILSDAEIAERVEAVLRPLHAHGWETTLCVGEAGDVLGNTAVQVRCGATHG